MTTTAPIIATPSITTVPVCFQHAVLNNEPVEVFELPLCIFWQDQYNDQKGFRIRLHYPASNEQFTYDVGPEVTTFQIPESDTPYQDSLPGRCLRRKQFEIVVTAIRGLDEWPVGSRTVTVECPLTEMPGTPLQDITPEPVFIGGDVRIIGWSPDGRYLAYFEYTEEQLAQSIQPDVPGTAPGTFTLYDTVTTEKCQRYQLDGTFGHEGPTHGQRHTWLSNGDLLIVTEDGQVLQADAPCGYEQNLTYAFAEPIRYIVNQSPDRAYLLFAGQTAYWLYHLQSGAAYKIEEITPDFFNNLVWSPDSKVLAVTLAGKYNDERSPVGGTRLVNVDNGKIITRYDWEPVNALDGTFGGPVWLNETEMVITVSYDQGPFFMTVDGQVRPLLPLFGLNYVRGQNLPYAEVYVEAASGYYHLLLSDMGGQGARLQPQIYHSENDSIETLPIASNNNVYLRSDGTVVVYGNGNARLRAITAVNEPLLKAPACDPLWSVPQPPYVAQSTDDYRIVTVYTWPDCQVYARLQPAEYSDAIMDVALSPNGQWLTIIPRDPQGRGQALFLSSLD
jgi:hypothetical protein